MACRRQAIIWTNAWILSIWSLGTNFSDIWIEIHISSFKKMQLKMSSAKCRTFCLSLNKLTLALPALDACRSTLITYLPLIPRCHSTGGNQRSYYFEVIDNICVLGFINVLLITLVTLSLQVTIWNAPQLLERNLCWQYNISKQLMHMPSI